MPGFVLILRRVEAIKDFLTEESPVTGYGDAVVAVRIRPEALILDDEFPGGRKDFRVEVGAGRTLKVTVEKTSTSLRDRSGDKQLRRYSQAQAPVATLTGNELGPFAGIDRGDRPRMAQLKERVLAYYAERFQRGLGAVDIPEFGSVQFTYPGKRELRKRFDPVRWKLVPAIPEILVRGSYKGRVPNTKPDRKPGHVAYHTFEAPIRLEGRDYLATVTVWEDEVGNKFYDLGAQPETPMRPRETRPPESPGEGGDETALSQSICPSP